MDIECALEMRGYDIQNRCLRLDPPLSYFTLSLLPSFRTASNIPFRLTDKAWTRIVKKFEAERGPVEEGLRKIKVASENNRRRKILHRGFNKLT